MVAHPKVLDAAVFGVPDDGSTSWPRCKPSTPMPTIQFAGELLAWLRAACHTSRYVQTSRSNSTAHDTGNSRQAGRKASV